MYAHKLQNKQHELTGIYNNISNRIKEGETMDSLYLDDFKAQLYNNTAVVTFYTVLGNFAHS
jgi:predicted transcriptional regulator YheO